MADRSKSVDASNAPITRNISNKRVHRLNQAIHKRLAPFMANFDNKQSAQPNTGRSPPT